MSQRLTNERKAGIRRSVLVKTFDADEKVIKDKIGRVVFNACTDALTPEFTAAANKNPTWFRAVSEFTVVVASFEQPNYVCTLPYGVAMPNHLILPYSGKCQIDFDAIQPRYRKSLGTFYKQLLELTARRDELKSMVNGVLSSFTTVKQLLDYMA